MKKQGENMLNAATAFDLLATAFGEDAAEQIAGQIARQVPEEHQDAELVAETRRLLRPWEFAENFAHEGHVDADVPF